MDRTAHATRPRPKSIAILAATGIAAGVSLAGISVASSPGRADALTIPATTCTVSTVYEVQNNENGITQLYAAQFANGSLDYTAIGGAAPFNYNGIAVDPRNNALYGFANATGTDSTGAAVADNDFLYIDRTTGDITDIGPLTNGPTSGHFNVGTMSDDGTFYGMSSGGGAGTLYTMNVDDPTLTATAVALTPGYSISDVAYLDGYLWGREDGNGRGIVRIDPTTGAETEYPAPDGMDGTSATGGMFVFGNGNLGFVNNSGRTTQVSVDDPSGDPTFSVVANYDSPSGIGTDGANCNSSPTDLSIVKTADSSIVEPDGTVRWTLTVTNNGPSISSGWVVTDNVPEGYTNVASSWPNVSIQGNTITASGGVLEAGSTVTIEVSATAPDVSQRTCLTNVASVVGNETDPDPSNDTSSAETCVTPGEASWTKVSGATGEALAGSEWSLTGPDGSAVAVIDNGENDADPADGALLVTGLDWGDYSLTETKAPEGYVLDDTAHRFTVNAAEAEVALGKIVNEETPTTPPTTPPATTPPTATTPPIPTATTPPTTPPGAHVNTGGTTGGPDLPWLWGGMLLAGLIAASTIAVVRRRGKAAVAQDD